MTVDVLSYLGIWSCSQSALEALMGWATETFRYVCVRGGIILQSHAFAFDKLKAGVIICDLPIAVISP